MRKEAETCDRCGLVRESGRQCEMCNSDTVVGWVEPEAASNENP